MKILAAIHPPDTAGAILECLGLPAPYGLKTQMTMARALDKLAEEKSGGVVI